MAGVSTLRPAVAVAVVLSLAAQASGAAPAPPVGAELARLAAPPAASALSSQRIYFALVDRYRNGDTANDRGGESGGFELTGHAPADSGGFHGGDLEGLTDDLERIRELGMTAIWITPPFTQRTTQGATAGYHGYWGVDFTRVDPHFGTNEDLRRLVEQAHALGLEVYLDVVVNHTGDVIRYAGAGDGGAPYVELGERPYRDVNGRPFDPAAVAGSAAFPDLFPDRRSFPYRPVVAPSDRAVKRPAWLNDLRNYHNRGETTFAGESITYGDFYGLDDLFTERPQVVRGLGDLWGGWAKELRLDGFRLDTLRHVDDAFWRSFLPRVRAEARDAGVTGFATFGEVFDPAATASAVRRLGVRSVLDFGFQSSAFTFAAGAASGADLATLFAQDDLYTTATSSARDLVTFLGNHDMGRIGYFLTQGGRSPAEALAADLLAHDLLFLLRGAPVVYYGDEAGMTGSFDGKDRNARQDMFPTAVETWKTEPRIGSGPVGDGDSYDLDHPVAERIASLAKLVDDHPALRNGAQLVRVAGSAPAFAVSRIDAGARREYVVAFNAGASARAVAVSTSSRGSFEHLWPGDGDDVETDGDGRVRVVVPPRAAVVLRAASPLPAPPAPRVELTRVAPDARLGLTRLAAAVPGADPATVTFAFRSEGTKRWVRLGTDGARPFRVFLEPGRFVRGREIAVVAIARTSDGQVAVSPVRTVVPRAR
jgi:glycosidase